MESTLNASPLQDPSKPMRARPRRKQSAAPSDVGGAMKPRGARPRRGKKSTPERKGIAGYVPFEMGAQLDETCRMAACRRARARLIPLMLRRVCGLGGRG